MYDRILVPLDGSNLAEVALPYTEDLASNLGSEVVLIRVSSELPYFTTDQDLEMVESDALRYLVEVGHNLQKRGIPTQTEVLFGPPGDKIVDYIENNDIDLIIMATHGRTGIRRWALGSVADKVVRAISRPIILIRILDAQTSVCEGGMLTKILVPLDSSVESEAVIPYVKGICSKSKAEVILFQSVPRAGHVYGAEMTIARVPYTDEEMEPLKAEAEAYLKTAANKLNGSGIIPRIVVTVGDAAEEVIKFSDKIPVDLVAMTTHGRSGIKRWVLGSVASKVLHAGNTPLLLVRISGTIGE